MFQVGVSNRDLVPPSPLCERHGTAACAGVIMSVGILVVWGFLFVLVSFKEAMGNLSVNFSFSASTHNNMFLRIGTSLLHVVQIAI